MRMLVLDAVTSNVYLVHVSEFVPEATDVVWTRAGVTALVLPQKTPSCCWPPSGRGA